MRALPLLVVATTLCAPAAMAQSAPAMLPPLPAPPPTATTAPAPAPGG